jgi:DNA repair photolyase
MASEVHQGRGAGLNPKNRFESIEVVADPHDDVPPDEAVAITTRFFRDPSRTIIASNDSPDVGFDRSINPYRGCEHGCIYCYARPTHEYLGYSAGLDFETKILVKEDAPELLRGELSAKSWVPQVIGLSGVTDCYQPVERELEITRRCLAVLAEFRNPCFVVTKNHLVARDADLLAELARHDAVTVQISITTLDPALARAMEPRASTPARRLEAIETLASHGVPVGVLTAPIVPALNDHEIPAILAAARARGAEHASYVMLRLPYAVKDLFEDWLERNFPDRKDKVLSRIRQLRDGKLNSTRFGDRMKGHGVFAEQVRALFVTACRKHGLKFGWPETSTAAFRVPGTKPQLSLW